MIQSNMRMKKVFPVLAILLVVLTAVGFAGCRNNIKLSTELDTNIRQGYLEQFIKEYNSDATIDDISIKYCYGIFNDCVAFTTNYDSYDASAIRSEKIGNVTFSFNGLLIKTWKDGSFYSLSEAFSLGYLSENNLRKIKLAYEMRK